MAKGTKQGRRRTYKCNIGGCGKICYSQRGLTQHIDLVHNNNNKKKNNNNKKINKNLLKKFIRFIMNIIFYINDNFDISNYVGDKPEQRQAMKMFLTGSRDIPLEKKIFKIEYNETCLVDDNAEIKEVAETVNKAYGDFGINLDEKIKEYKEKFNKGEEERKKREAEELKEYNEIMNFLAKFDKKSKKNEKEESKIKIKRNIIEKIRDIRKKEIITAMECKLFDINAIDNIDDLEGKEIDPIIAYEADHLYPKISARDLFNHMDINEKNKKFINDYINKNYIDYPTDKEIEEAFPLAYNHYTRTLSGNGLYKKKYDEIKSKILEFLENGGQSFTCEFCKKYINNKRRHCLHCSKFLNEIDNDPKQLKLKKYIEENYKKIPLKEIDIIIENFEKKYKNYKKNQKSLIKKSEFFKKNLPHFIKFEQKERKRIMKINQEKGEIAEMKIREVSQIPPIQREPGLAKKFFEEIKSNLKIKKDEDFLKKIKNQ